MIDVDALDRADLARLLRAAADIIDPPAVEQPVVEPLDDDAGEWIELPTAAERFGAEQHKLRRWCRDFSIGRKRGGRWIVSVDRLRRYVKERTF